MKGFIKRYRFFFLTLAGLLILTWFNRELGASVFVKTGYNLKEMLLVIPPIFLLLGLLDVWVPRQTMIRYMGEGSGLKGIVLAVLIGSAAAGPLYGAFPVAAVFMKKGVKFSNIMIFIGAWSTTKVPMFLFEITALGPVFAFTRLAIDIPGIIIIGWLLTRLVPKSEVDLIVANAENL